MSWDEQAVKTDIALVCHKEKKITNKSGTIPLGKT